MWQNIFSRRNPLDTVEKVDRQRFFQSRRLICGLYLPETLDELSAALVLAEGSGNWLKLRVAALENESISASLQSNLRSICQEGQPKLVELTDAIDDLTDLSSQLIWRLKAHAGKAVEHVLAVALLDPGIWMNLDDTRRYVGGFCAPDALAEKCSLTVIDSVPARDVAVGGNGSPLEPLPFWYLFAEREAEISKTHRIVICLDDRDRWFHLPPSDGLDHDLPDVRCGNLISRGQQSIRNALESSLPQLGEILENVELIVTGKHFAKFNPEECDWIPHKQITTSGKFDIDPEAMMPTVAAMLGIAHLDQLPMNLPQLTGADAPRILGRITPGKPSNWRRVLLNMSDHRPPTMKLRDAI